jgi:hypothetical protein
VAPQAAYLDVDLRLLLACLERCPWRTLYGIRLQRIARLTMLQRNFGAIQAFECV